jgi:outer membrane protein
MAAVLGLQAALLAETNAPAGSGGQPKWEAGLFVGATRLPHYKGSDHYDSYVLPIPFFIYRGDWIQSDREGVRGVFFKNLRFESIISLSGHPPVDGDDTTRDGMPELSPLIEAGPAIKWWPLGKREAAAFFAQLAGRTTASIDVDDHFDLAHEGLRGELSLHYSHAFADGRWRTGTSLSLYAGDHDYHGYFYDVPEPYATEVRPAYNAKGGYGGCGLSLFVTRKLRKNLSGGLYARWDYLGGAVFDDSPLVDRNHSITLGTALIWRFAESSRRVSRPE